jgi:L-fuconolactonase
VSVIDAHQHLWNPANADYPWLTPDLTVLDRVFTQADIAGQLRVAGIDRTVLVQAADNLADTANMLREAERDATIAGVVAWLPLTQPDEAAVVLDRWAAKPIVGVRHMVHRDPDPGWLLRPDVAAGLRLLAERGLPFDVCAENPQLLAQVPALAASHPTLTLIVGHLGKPPIREQGWQPWAQLLRDAAAAPNVVAKLSGLNTAAADGWNAASFQPYVDHALEVFGPDRLMYGGDWPFALLAADSYAQIHAALLDTLGALAPNERDAVLGGTAERVYHLTAEGR